MPALPITVSGLKPGALGLKAFTFTPRTLKLNWRSLSTVSLEKVVRNIDVDTLQDHLEMITFCNAATSDVAQYADPNFIKLFRLSQLIIEYTLYTMEIIDEARLNIEKELASAKKVADDAKKKKKELEDENSLLKKELKLQRKTIAIYEDRLTKVMDNEKKLKKAATTNTCQICGKVFSTPAFLASHVTRRHSHGTGYGSGTTGHCTMPGCGGPERGGVFIAGNGFVAAAPNAGTGGTSMYPQSGGVAQVGSGASRLGSNAGALESEEEDELPGGTNLGGHLAQRQREQKQQRERDGDKELSNRLKQLYQNMDDDLSIKLDRERMEFARREEQLMTAHKIEMHKMENDIRELKQVMASFPGVGAISSGFVGDSRAQIPEVVSNAGILEDDNLSLGEALGAQPGAPGMVQPVYPIQEVVNVDGRPGRSQPASNLPTATGLRGLLGSNALELEDDMNDASQGFRVGGGNMVGQSIPLGADVRAADLTPLYGDYQVGASGRVVSGSSDMQRDRDRAAALAAAEATKPDAAGNAGGIGGVQSSNATSLLSIRIPKDPADEKRMEAPLVDNPLIKSQMELTPEEVAEGKEKVQQSLQDQLAIRDVPASGRQGRLMDQDRFTKVMQDLETQRQARDGSLKLKGIADTRASIKEKLEAMTQLHFAGPGAADPLGHAMPPGPAPQAATRAARDSDSSILQRDLDAMETNQTVSSVADLSAAGVGLSTPTNLPQKRRPAPIQVSGTVAAPAAAGGRNLAGRALTATMPVVSPSSPADVEDVDEMLAEFL